jgi:hypothetical protein
MYIVPNTKPWKMKINLLCFFSLALSLFLLFSHSLLKDDHPILSKKVRSRFAGKRIIGVRDA